MDISSTAHPLLPGLGAAATLLFVHAHPDDETIVTGATMAAYAKAGARVVLLTCTRGELGEVIPDELAHLEVGNAAGVPADGTGLAAERERELAAALSALGVQEHIWLGQPPAAAPGAPELFRDSGMKWGPDGRAMAADTVLDGSLSRAPLTQLAELAANAIRAIRPDALITYAADGGYGHPDHVRTHELAMAGLDLAQADDGGTPGWRVGHVFAIVSDRPERPLEAGVTRLAVAGDIVAKTAAMRAHRTQITVSGEQFALSDDVWREISGVEEFVAVPRKEQAHG